MEKEQREHERPQDYREMKSEGDRAPLCHDVFLFFTLKDLTGPILNEPSIPMR